MTTEQTSVNVIVDGYQFGKGSSSHFDSIGPAGISHHF